MEEPRVEEPTTEPVEFSIPLQEIEFDAHVTGIFAQIICEQKFKNENDVSVEAIYVFPLPEDASVVGCHMMIGEKEIEAELKGKEQAKQEYQDAVDAGHHASLLEQKRPNIFTISVGGIEPGEDITISTTYTQRVSWQDNGGRLTIPLVVAPRFIPGVTIGSKTGGGWAEDTNRVPDASEITPIVLKDGVEYTASIHAILSPGFPCSVTSPSHEMVETLVREINGNESRFDCIELEIAEVAKPIEIIVADLAPDRDFILCYQTKSAAVATSIHATTFEEEEYITIDVIPPGIASPKAKDVVFCLDISGSMGGPKLAGLKVIAEKVAKRLLAQDADNHVAVVAFSDGIHPIHAMAEITESTYVAIQSLSEQGGTMAGAAIDHCMNMLSGDTEREQYILLVSDGQTEDSWSVIKPGIRVVAMGIDTAVNMSYLKDIARDTNGVSLAVYPGEDYDRVATTLAGYLAGPVMTDIGVVIDDKPVEEVLGIQDVYANMPASLALKTAAVPSNLQLVGKDSQGNRVVTVIDMSLVSESVIAHQIWAREKLRNRNLTAEELVEISLGYGVLCGKTAFVAVSIKDVPGEKPQRIEVPVALPAMWDYDKVFGEVPMGGRMVRRSFMASLPGGQSVSGHVSFASVSHLAGQGFPDELILEAGGIALSGDDSSQSASSDSAGKSGYHAPGSYVGSKAPVHVVDELEELVEALDRGYTDREDAEAIWVTMVKKLNIKAAARWSATQKAKAYYYLLKLRTFGFDVPKELIRHLSVGPAASDSEALEWWSRAKQVLGVAKAVR